MQQWFDGTNPADDDNEWLATPKMRGERGKRDTNAMWEKSTTSFPLLQASTFNLQDSTVYIHEQLELDVKLDQQIKHIRNHVRRMGESIWFPRRAQHLINIEWLSTLKPSGIIGVYRKAFCYMYIFMNSLGPDVNVRKRTMLVKGPAIDVISVM